jgi:ribosomal protein S18 acetylase RimI-like enzyme
LAHAVPGVRLVRDPRITPKELHAFYARTGVCEAGFPPSYAGRVLTRSDVVLGAFHGSTLVGFARGLCDGTAGYVAELCVDPAFQGAPLRHSNASVIERDRRGLGLWLGAALLEQLRKQGATFFSVYAIEGIEEPFYRSLGFEENTGHRMYYIDIRDYVPVSRRGGRLPRLPAGRGPP